MQLDSSADSLAVLGLCNNKSWNYVAGVLYPCIAVGTAHQASTIEERCSPLRISGVPFLSFESSPDWDEAIRSMSQNTKDILDGRCQATPIPPPVYL